MTPGFSFWTTGLVKLQRNALANLEELKSTVDVYADSLNMDEVPRPSRHVRTWHGSVHTGEVAHLGIRPR